MHKCEYKGVGIGEGESMANGVLEKLGENYGGDLRPLLPHLA